ncbi:MAG: hypothetical protein WEA36_04780 [Balneolaceae bacterium]
MNRSIFHHFQLILASVLIMITSSACTKGVSSLDNSNTLTEQELNTGFPLNKNRLDLTNPDEDSTFKLEFINEYSDTLYRFQPQTISLQFYDSGEWKDKWTLDEHLMISPYLSPVLPEESIGPYGINVRELFSQEKDRFQNGFYRFHFYVFHQSFALPAEDVNRELLPEEERTSVPFEVIM